MRILVIEPLSAAQTSGRPTGSAQTSGDTDLVQAAKAGHQAAFATLCERHAQRLFRTAHRITRNREDAEDAVQETLLRVFVHIRDFDGRSSFSTWITRIAINSSLMILRKKGSSLQIACGTTDDLGASGPSYEIPDRAPNPERQYARSEEEGIMREAIQHLRPALREVVKIQQLQERSMRETARALGISVAAAKGRLFHAKIALRKTTSLRIRHQPRLGGGIRVLSAA